MELKEAIALMDNNLDEYYPDGVHDSTKVSAVIAYNGNLYLYENRAAQSFGWSKTPARPCVPGLEPTSAPLTHYKILDV